MKKLSIVLLLIVVLLSIVGCEKELPMSTLPALNNDLANGKLEIVKDVPGESFKLVTSYETSYDVKTWRITDSKFLTMRAKLDSPFDGVVLVEHMHADVALKARLQELDGWTQDSMDDSVHGGMQPGFLISDKVQYENQFAIEGFTETLISGWGFYCNGIGLSAVNEHRLTEEHLIDQGRVYGNKVQIVYDLLIKSKGDEYWRTRSVIVEFQVPVATR